MSRYSIANSAPPQPTLEGDDSFIGLDMATPREKLKSGWYPLAINKRSATGDMETRPGTIMPVFANLWIGNNTDIVVTGAGTPAVNGAYAKQPAQQGGHDWFKKRGSTSEDLAADRIVFHGFGHWRIYGPLAQEYYKSISGDTLSPADASGWEPDNESGLGPMPTVTRVRILGSGNYMNPHGLQSRLVATPSLVYSVRDGSYPGSIAIPDDVTLNGPVEFTQVNDKILLHAPSDGEEGVQLVWDGVSSEGFVRAAVSDPAVEITSTLPANTPWSASMADRDIIPIGSDQLACSDDLDPTTFDLTLTGPKFRSHSGSADPIVGAIPFTQAQLIVFKRDSIDVVNGFAGDLTQTTVQVLSGTVGAASRKAVGMTGGDLIFPYDTGVYRLTQIIQDRLETTPLPVASRRDDDGNVVDPISPLLKRINWAVASKQRGAVHGGFYYWAVALDGASSNNAILVLNLAKDAWEGFDLWTEEDPLGTADATASLISIDDLYVAKYLGVSRVWAIDYAANAIYVLYEGKIDQLKSGEYQVSDLFETRGYSTLGWNASTARESKRVEIALRTWNPLLSVTQIMDGAFDERSLTGNYSRDPAKYTTWGKPDFALDNVNGDWDAPGREDYSIPDGNYFDASDGIDPDRKQNQIPLRFSLKSRGRFTSFRIANTRGQADVCGVLFESSGNQRELRRA